MTRSPKASVLCLLGVQREELFLALEESKERQVFYVGCPQEEAFWKSHPQIRCYILNTLLQRSLAAREIAWLAVMQPLEVRAAPGWEGMHQTLLECHHAARLLLAEVSDFGGKALSNALVNWQEHAFFLEAADLKGLFPKVPAIVCGAGPSLEKALPFLKKLEGHALLLAAGTALPLLGKEGIEPHIGFAIDKQASVSAWRKLGLAEIPICAQSRFNPEILSLFQGEKLLSPESGPLPWERAWREAFDESAYGWTVGNFATQWALLMGCDPIIWTGMDFCYRGGKKYAGGDQAKGALFSVKNRRGEWVDTQPDWILAARWNEELAASHPDVQWIDLSEEGLMASDSIRKLSWEQMDAICEGQQDLRGRVHAALQSARKISLDSERMAAWKNSLQRALYYCESCNRDALEREIVYQFYLEPLWAIWRPVFLGKGLQADLERHRFLFFLQALQSIEVVAKLSFS